MKKYLVELIGMFLFVLTVGMVAIDPGGAGNLAPLAIGSVLMILVYAGGHVSGGHYNPAVTLGVWLRGRLPAADVLPYWMAQIIGAAVATQVVLYLKGNPAVTPPDLKTVPALVAEFIGTFALVYVVLNVATARGTTGNSYYGLAIGFTVLVMAFALGPVSGGASRHCDGHHAAAPGESRQLLDIPGRRFRRRGARGADLQNHQPGRQIAPHRP